MTIKEKILQLFTQSKDWSVKQIVDELMVSKQAVHLALTQLLETKKVLKLGKAPKTIYRLNNEKAVKKSVQYEFSALSDEDIQYLEKKVLLINETGEMLSGVKAFEYWCSIRKLPVEKTLLEYKKTQIKYDTYRDASGFINGMNKIKNTEGYEKIWLDDLYYLDFYAIERFGKTRLGTLLHYAKQGQSKMLMKILVTEMKAPIEILLQRIKPNAVAFVPPTIRREVQLMKFLETHLKLNFPKINIQKIGGLIPVPQKSLSKLNERIINAENTFSITETKKYNHLVLIDDAVGSGSTLNQIAGKLKDKKIAQKVTGIAIVGSFKGFDVITDV